MLDEVAHGEAYEAALGEVACGKVHKAMLGEESEVALIKICVLIGCGPL